MRKIFLNITIMVAGAMVLGFFNPISLQAKMTPCIQGVSAGFECANIDMESSIDLSRSGIRANSGNDIWGWTDPETGREYALMGLSSKTAFVDVTDPEKPVHVGDLATHSYNSLWRDVKVYKDHAFIVSEAWGHGLQVFDLTELRFVNSEEPVEFEETAYYDEFGSAHNIVINEDSGTAWAVGSDTCDEGMHMIDIRIPTEPEFVTCIDREIFEDVGEASFGSRVTPGHVKGMLARYKEPSSDGFMLMGMEAPFSVSRALGLKSAETASRIMHGDDYTHDAQCVQYHGPDVRYQGREICVASNADSVNIVDLTNRSAPTQISVRDYDGLGYTHQGWLTEDHRYFLLGDELDEMNFNQHTTTLIWDVSDLEKPALVGDHVHETTVIDHNMYVKGNYVYQANYEGGVRVLSLDYIEEGKLEEVAFFDTYPQADDPEFEGAWSVYPYFESGTIVVSNIDGTLYVLTPLVGLDGWDDWDEDW